MRIDKNHWLKNRPVAHRGLWGGDIAENSITAYKNAAEKGYPIEIDLYLSTDGVLYSFHDDTLKRMTGEDGKIFDKSSEELNKLRLVGTDEKIPTFEEVLSIAEGKVPLLIEIKDQPNKEVVDKTVERLKTYKGEFAVQSFNPLYINRVKKLAPEFIRGILATENKWNTPFKNFILKNMPLNFMIKPDFISYSYTGLPLKKSKTHGKSVICWTVTDKNTADRVKPFTDNIIFEGFIPKK